MAPIPAERSSLTVADVAALAKVAPEVVRGWIQSGKLPAWNAATKAGPLDKRRWRVDPGDYAAFEARGRKAPPAPEPAWRRSAARSPSQSWLRRGTNSRP